MILETTRAVNKRDSGWAHPIRKIGGLNPIKRSETKYGPNLLIVHLHFCECISMHKISASYINK